MPQYYMRNRSVLSGTAAATQTAKFDSKRDTWLSTGDPKIEVVKQKKKMDIDLTSVQI